MTDKNMLDNKVLDDLCVRIHNVLDTCGQFDRLTKNGGSIRIDVGDRDYIRIRLQLTYPTDTRNSVFVGSASGLRIKFESSVYTHPVKTFMVPRWEKAQGKWVFSRTKLLQKATAAVGTVKRGKAQLADACQKRKAFVQLVDKEFKEYAETGNVRTYERGPEPEVTIEHQQLIVTLTYTGDEMFRVRGLCLLGYGHNIPCYSIPEIKELITKLNEIFTPREITLENGEAIDDRTS